MLAFTFSLHTVIASPVPAAVALATRLCTSLSPQLSLSPGGGLVPCSRSQSPSLVHWDIEHKAIEHKANVTGAYHHLGQIRLGQIHGSVLGDVVKK